jgi:hypothetical protein
LDGVNGQSLLRAEAIMGGGFNGAKAIMGEGFNGRRLSWADS